MDLSRLSRAEKLELIAALEEKERRAKDKRPIFADRAHSEQIAVLASREIERFVFAGNGSGKTALGAEDTRCAITGHNPHNGDTYAMPCRAYIILDKPDKVEQVVLPELRKWMNIKPEQCHKKGKPYISEIDFGDKGFIKFLFWDQEPMTAEGIEGDYFWFDEPPPRALYVALRRAGRTKGKRARYLITGTPLSAPWLRTEVYEPWSKGERPNTACFRFHTEMNKKNLADGYIEEFSAVLTEKERGIRLAGEFFDLEGLALSHLFRRDTHTIRRSDLHWDRQNPCVLVMDPHPSKPHHAVLMGADRDGYLYVLEEFKKKATARQFAEALIEKGWHEDYRLIDIVSDSLGSAETTSGEGFRPFIEVVNEVFSRYGLGRCRATRYEEKSDEDFIDRIQDVLLIPDEPNNYGEKVPKLRLVSDCVGTMSDVENVQWKRDKALDQNKPALEISNRDYLSCVKYALACNLYFSKKKDAVYYRKTPAYGVKLASSRPQSKLRLRYRGRKAS